MIRKLSYTVSAVAWAAFAQLAPPASAQSLPAGSDLLSPRLEAGPTTDAGIIDANELADINGEGIVIDSSLDIEDSAITVSELNATNTDNVIAGGLHTGDVNFAGDALRGFSGVGNFVVNTGAQSNLQGSINITIGTGR